MWKASGIRGVLVGLLAVTTACGSKGEDSERPVPGFAPDRPIDPRLRRVTYTTQSEQTTWIDEFSYADPGPMSVALVYDGAPRSFLGYCVDHGHFIDDTVHEGFLY